MALYTHNQLAFDNWYRGEADSYWCVSCEDEHVDESECAEVISFATGLASALVSDDAVDINLWRATHSVETAE